MKPKTFNTTPDESDTYELADRPEKEVINQEAIESHWSIRARREGVQSVMSARHSIEENELATQALQRDVLQFLGGLKGLRVFELGVGIGRMTSELSRHAREVVGCDLTQGMLERAHQNLSDAQNVTLHHGRITDMDYKPNSFDLVFDSIVLLHILNPDELRATLHKMREMARRVFLCEHTYEGPDFPISKYSILRKPEEYHQLMKPYRLVREKTHFCAGDRFTMMLYER